MWVTKTAFLICTSEVFSQESTISRSGFIIKPVVTVKVLKGYPGFGFNNMTFQCFHTFKQPLITVITLIKCLGDFNAEAILEAFCT